VDARVPVQPVALYYGPGTGSVAFVGEGQFPHHLWALLAAEPVVAEITYLPVLSTVSGDCRLLANESWRAVTHTLTRLELFEIESRSRLRIRLRLWARNEVSSGRTGMCAQDRRGAGMRSVAGIAPLDGKP